MLLRRISPRIAASFVGLTNESPEKCYGGVRKNVYAVGIRVTA